MLHTSRFGQNTSPVIEQLALGYFTLVSSCLRAKPARKYLARFNWSIFLMKSVRFNREGSDGGFAGRCFCRRSWYAGQVQRKCPSSSTIPILHNLQVLSDLSSPMYLSLSTRRSWFEVMNLVICFLSLNGSWFRY